MTPETVQVLLTKQHIYLALSVVLKTLASTSTTRQLEQYHSLDQYKTEYTSSHSKLTGQRVHLGLEKSRVRFRQ